MINHESILTRKYGGSKYYLPALLQSVYEEITRPINPCDNCLIATTDALNLVHEAIY